MTFEFKTLGVIHSCFKEKFGIPRQPGLVAEARATLELLPPYNQPETVRGIEQFSHVWLLFIFHDSPHDKWQPLVRPPRLGGNQRIGLFASRTTFRPNPIGMSAVKLERVESGVDGLFLHLKGVDLLDGTPVVDIKPYIPYADSLPNAEGGFAHSAPPRKHTITFTADAARRCHELSHQYTHLRTMIEQLLQSDPRPAYKEEERGRVYGMRLWDFDLRWRVTGDQVEVLELAKMSGE